MIDEISPTDSTVPAETFTQVVIEPQRRFSSYEFSKVARLMQEHHTLFYEMWKLGKPIFDKSIPTACIAFNEEGQEIEYRINPDFWDTQNDKQKCFIIGHESFHGVANHGLRANVKIDGDANRAMDIVVNHGLVDYFGFDRKQVDPTDKYCWLDTVFKDCSDEVKKDIKEDESFEYYYHKILKHGCKNGELVDDHTAMGDASKFLKKLGESLSNEAKEELKDFIKKNLPETSSKMRGEGAGGMEFLMPQKKVKKKKKWETVIKKWAKQFLNIKDKDIAQWARMNRRFTILSNDLLIPSDMEMEDFFKDDRKIQVWFFQDTSGSCSGFLERFFTAAESLPPERFDVKMHCFDTKVYETTLESRKIYGGGGTSFDILEDYILKYCAKNHVKYPAAVFVVTDGDGNAVKPLYPKHWHWFLSVPHTNYIPPDSRWYNLQDYE